MQALPFVPITTGNYPDLLTMNYTTGAITLGADNISDNLEIAQLICAWRDGSGLGYAGTPHGPFTSIADLNKIVAINDDPTDPTKRVTFANRFGSITPTTQLDDNDGDLTPVTQGTTDGVVDGFEKRFLQLTRVSNLITTRSDTFTVYVLVQGWRNAGSLTNGPTPPELVVQRRAAIIVDRNNLTISAGAKSGSLSTVNVPTE